MVAPHLEWSPSDVANSPVPPNIAFFLDHGLRDSGRWFVPLVLGLRPEVTSEDVRSVLSAVTNHHDALRLMIVERAGMWEQQIAPPQEFTRLSTRLLPPDVTAGSAAEREAILAILAELVTERDVSQTPMTAAYIVDAHGAPRDLAIALHRLACDDESREIVLADIATALGQRLAGEDVTLPPVTLPWVEWSQRFTALATDPEVLGSRDFWLDNSASATLRPVDHDIAERPHAADLAKLSAPLTRVLTIELDEAELSLGLATDEILLAALGRSIARTFGEGVASVDLAAPGRSAVMPDVDVHRTVGCFTPIYPVPVPCVSSRKASATAMLGAVHRALGAVPNCGIGYGLLRYIYAPTAMQLAVQPPSDVFFSYLGTVPALPSSEQRTHADIDPAMPVRDSRPGLGHALELRAYRVDGLLHLDWWYDTRRLDRSTVEELTEQFPLALIELTSEAISPFHQGIEMAMASETFALAGR